MSYSYMRVTFPKTDALTYNRLEPWRCVNFKSCSYWQPAQSLMWTNLPKNKFAMFFESSRCNDDGKYIFTSVPGLSTGIKKFQSPKSIQSMMIGEGVDRTLYPLSTYYTCRNKSKAEHSSIESVNETNVDSLYELELKYDDPDGTFSSNWFDGLEEEPTTSGSPTV